MKTIGVTIKPLAIVFSASFPELWWTDVSDGSRLWHLMDIGIVERSLDDGTPYKGIQVILLFFSLCVGMKPKRRSPLPFD